VSALRAARVGLPLVVIAAGVLLRAWHLGTPSLWWDEVIEIATAELPDVASVVRQVRDGIPPGRGNAGAMPLDYVLLHGWLGLGPPPTPRFVEVYYRFPAFLWASLGLVAIFACGRSLFGWGTGVLAAAVLGLMIPHVLYAAEVRPYALVMLLSILNLMAFARLARRPERVSAWLVWAASALGFVSAALFAIIPLVWQQAVLGATLARRLGGRAGALALGSIGALATVLGVWYAGADLASPHGRGSLAAEASFGASWHETLATADFVFSRDRLLALVFLVALPAPIVRAWRGERALLPVAIVLSTGVLVIPLVVEVERWKDYYFHPRHILFVLPYVALVTAAGIDGALTRLDPLRALVRDRGWRTWSTVLAAVVLVVAVHAPAVARYLRTPDVFFARTKTLRDFKPLVRALRWQLWNAEPGTRFVLVAERNRPGHIANPVLRRYLRWWGIERRVALHGTDRPETVVATLAQRCPDGCAGEPVDALVRRLGVGEAIDSPVRFRGLLQLAGPEDVGGGAIAGVGVLAYPRGAGPRPPAPPGWQRVGHTGLSLTTPAPQRQGSAARVSQ
jgi:hypothetical protein